VIDYDARAWLRLSLVLRGSVLPRLVLRVLAVALFGAVAYALMLKTGFHLPPLVHTLLGIPLGLLLVFRTNSSYDRFWEGRRLLGMYTNRMRDLGRQIATFVADEQQRARLLRLCALHFRIVAQGLRGERDLSVLGPLLTDGERAALEACPGRPTRVHTWLGQAFAQAASSGVMAEPRLILIDANLVALADAWGGAERITRTPIPFAYAQHIKTFLSLFIFTAPFAMVDAMGPFTPLASALLAFALFGIDEIGVEIEDPFGYDLNDLPVDAVGDTIATDLAVAGETRLVP
jgi:ion channel-forming bestrophin family protein